MCENEVAMKVNFKNLFSGFKVFNPNARVHIYGINCIAVNSEFLTLLSN